MQNTTNIELRAVDIGQDPMTQGSQYHRPSALVNVAHTLTTTVHNRPM